MIVTNTEPKIMAISEDIENALKSIINYYFQTLRCEYKLYDFFNLFIISLKLTESADKRLLISLLIFFNQIPNFQLIYILHLILNYLFEFLRDNAVKNIAKKCLDDFYNEISINFNNIPNDFKKKLLDILIQINQNEENKMDGIESIEIKFYSIKWMSLFLKKIIKKYIESKDNSNGNEEDIINKYVKRFKKILKIMLNIIKNKNEKSEYFKKDDKNDTSFYYHFKEITSSLKSFFKSNQIKKKDRIKNEFETIIADYLATDNETLLEQLVEYIKIFFEIFQEDAFSKCTDFLENFSFILTSEDEKIFTVGKKTLDEILKNKDYQKKIKVLIEKLLKNLENKDSDFIIKRTEEFIKLLIEKINKQTVYELFVVELDKIKNKEFVIKIINIINNQLLDLNNAEIIKYRVGESDEIKKRNKFFEKLFETWSINSISCLLLCLIAEDFELSYELLKNFGKINLTQNDLDEYSQIIQIFESKKFTSKYIF